MKTIDRCLRLYRAMKERNEWVNTAVEQVLETALHTPDCHLRSDWPQMQRTLELFLCNPFPNTAKAPGVDESECCPNHYEQPASQSSPSSNSPPTPTPNIAGQNGIANGTNRCVDR